MLFMIVNLQLGRRLLKEQAQPKLSVVQLAALNEQRAVLHRRIVRWRQIQTFYMPATSALHAKEFLDDGETPTAEDILLYLPSGCFQVIAVTGDLVALETRLRLAQIEDALVELQRLLRISSGLWQFKRTQVGPSQRASTRMRSLITRFKDKIDRCAQRYRVAHSALVGLDPQGNWSKKFHELRAEHVKGPRREDDDASEGRRELSWIWMVRPQAGVATSTENGEFWESE